MVTDLKTGLKKQITSLGEVSEQFTKMNKNAIEIFEQGTEMERIVKSCLDFKDKYVYQYPKSENIFDTTNLTPYKKYINMDSRYIYKYTKDNGEIVTGDVMYCDEIYNTDEDYNMGYYNETPEKYYEDNKQKAKDNIEKYLGITSEEKQQNIINLTEGEKKSCGLCNNGICPSKEKIQKSFEGNNNLLNTYEICYGKVNTVYDVRDKRLQLLEKINAVTTSESATTTVISKDDKITEELSVNKEGASDYIISTSLKQNISASNFEDTVKDIMDMDISTDMSMEDMNKQLNKAKSTDGSNCKSKNNPQDYRKCLVEDTKKLSNNKMEEEISKIEGPTEVLSKIVSIFSSGAADGVKMIGGVTKGITEINKAMVNVDSSADGKSNEGKFFQEGKTTTDKMESTSSVIEKEGNLYKKLLPTNDSDYNLNKTFIADEAQKQRDRLDENKAEIQKYLSNTEESKRIESYDEFRNKQKLQKESILKEYGGYDLNINKDNILDKLDFDAETIATKKEKNNQIIQKNNDLVKTSFQSIKSTSLQDTNTVNTQLKNTNTVIKTDLNDIDQYIDNEGKTFKSDEFKKSLNMNTINENLIEQVGVK